jgi:hypothetical protein
MKENPLTMDAVRSARRTEHYSTCCNSPNSTCYNGMDSYHYSKKRLLRQFRHYQLRL